MKMKTRAKIIAATLMITVALIPASVALAEDTDGDGIDDVALTESASLAVSSFAASSTVLSGYNVLVTGQPGYIGTTATRIGNLGASVTQAAPSTLTSDMLAQYDVVWISLGGADDVDNAGKADIVKSYVHNGGGLILEQPNVVMTPKCLPYAFPIVNIYYSNQCNGTILDPDHYLTQGLTIVANEIPATYDTVGTIGPEWTVLAIDNDGDPKLSVACYGAGKLIVELGNTSTSGCVCGVCMKDVMIERMINWAATGEPLTETSSTESSLVETLVSQEGVLENVTITGDFESTLDFTGFEIVSITTGPWAGKGFSKGQCETTFEEVSYSGSWQGAVFPKPEEGKIYLKGLISGEIAATVEGYLTESVPESGIYDEYQATWRIGRLGTTTTSATINLKGSLSYQSSSEFPDTELYLLQTNIEGNLYGHHSGPLSTVINHVRVADGSNPYWGQGFSIISYVSETGSGQGWTYDELTSPGRIQLRGLFTSPLFGIVSGTLDETEVPRSLFLGVTRVDLGLPPMADLEVRTWGPSRVSPGQTVDYIIEYRNDGLKPADDVVVLAAIDPIVEYMSSSHSYYNEDINEVSMGLGTIDPKQMGLLRITTRLPWGLLQGTSLENGARISSTSKDLDLSKIDTTGWRQDIQPGDIVLERNERSKVLVVAPGSHWTHAGGVVYGTEEDSWTGGREGYFVIEAVPNHYREGINEGGIIATPIENWDHPSKNEVIVFRVENLTTEQKNYIGNFWENQIGKPYQDWYKYPFKDSNVGAPEWYCSELVWGPYFNLGIDFDSDAYGSSIAPQEIHNSEFTFPLPGASYNFRDLEMNRSEWPFIIAVARDPSVKYGPEGRVSPRQRLDYKVEYENEGQGIAFGVYFTDILDEDLDDSTLEIGPVIDVNDGSIISGPGIYNPATRTITWFAGEVGPGEGGITEFSVNVRDDAPEGTEIINYATIYFPSVPEETRTNGIVSIVSLNQPPVADAGVDQTAEQESYEGTEVTLDGSGSTDPDSAPGTNDDIVSFDWYEGDTLLGTGEIINYTFLLGSHAVTLVVTDSFGETDSNEVIIIVQDTTPPEFALSVAPTVLRPPNHKMVLITPSWTVSDRCDPTPDVSLVSITTNEGDDTNAYDPMYDDTVGDGHTIDDIRVGEDGSIYLRAERSGTGNDRVYTITYQAVDDSGNVTTRSATVTVPHDQR